MKSRNARRTPFVLLRISFFVGTLGSMVFAQEIPQLVQELFGQQIPIKEIVKRNDTIVAKLDYPIGDPKAAGQMMAHKNTVFRKLAEEFPESTTIRIEIYEDGELIFPFVAATDKIEDYLNEAPTEIESYPESEVDVADPIPFPPDAGVVETSAVATTDTLVAPATTFWQKVNWPLVGVLFIFSYCTLLVAVILVVKKMRPTRIDPPQTQVIESLLVSYPDGQKIKLRMPEERMSIGRNSSNMLILQDSHVSSFHAEILVKPDGYVVKDLESTNGVFVNDTKISEKTLHPGDIIKIGTTTITAS